MGRFSGFDRFPHFTGGRVNIDADSPSKGTSLKSAKTLVKYDSKLNSRSLIRRQAEIVIVASLATAQIAYKSI